MAPTLEEPAQVSIGTLLALLLGTVVPALTALFTRMHASERVKSLCQAMLAAVAGALTGAILAPPPGVSVWLQTGECVLLAWIAAGAAFVAAWKPSGAAHAIAVKTPNFGIGPRKGAAP